MTKRRWLNAAIAEAAKPQPAAVFSRQARIDRLNAKGPTLRATA